MGNADLSSLMPARGSDACMRVSRLMEKHIPKQQKTNFIYAMAEKLEMAPPEVFAAEVNERKLCSGGADWFACERLSCQYA